MLRPFLIVGVGGSGGKTIRGLRQQLELQLQQRKWTQGIPRAWQMIHFDTPTLQDGKDFEAPFLDSENYTGLVETGLTYELVVDSIMHASNLPSSAVNDVKRMLPNPANVRVDVTIGAGQYRAVGRAVVLSTIGDVVDATNRAISRINDATAIGELENLSTHLGLPRSQGAVTDPTVIIVSSIAGGSGAGQYLDVTELVKTTVSERTSNQIFSILYSPEVFDQVAQSAGMAGNALAAISEAVNGYWTSGPTRSTVELFRGQGAHPSYDGAMDHVGAEYPFIVGRSNSRVTFSGQNEVYRAVAASLTAWMMDERIQDSLIAYAQGNWAVGKGPSSLPDETRLMNPLAELPPFSALGFGSVSLGRDRFLQYGSERLARSAIDRMLFAHAESDPSFRELTEQEWIATKATQGFQSYVRALRLNEETEDNDDVIDALRADSQPAAMALVGQEALAYAREGVNGTTGLTAQKWSDRLLTQYDESAARLLAQDVADRGLKLNQWVTDMPKHVLATIGSAVADLGLPVVIAMNVMLDQSLRSASAGLKGESEKYAAWSTPEKRAQLLSEDLHDSKTPDAIRPNSDVIEHARERLEQSFQWQSESRMRMQTSLLLIEFCDGFLKPLNDHLTGLAVALLAATTSKTTPDNRPNDFPTWPTRQSETMPQRYEPAPNERLLVDYRDFPKEFADLIKQTTGKEVVDSGLVAALGAVIAGTAEDDATVAPADRWTLLTIEREWNPAVTADEKTKGSASLGGFKSTADLEKYVDRARRWLRRDGFAFGAYLTADLKSYFDQHQITPDVYAQRRDKFTREFTAALSASEPLVKLNPGLLSAVHKKNIREAPMSVFSAIPFDNGTEMYEVAKAVLSSAGLWDENKSPGWFSDQRATFIEVFSMSAFSYEPIVMDSVMAPIARAWSQNSNSINTRADFWQFKRARPLVESMPADTPTIEAMIAGWYVAKMLGRIKTDSSDRARGPEISIWDPETRKQSGFPFPLLFAGIAESHDHLGAVMESLIVTLALCNAQGSLAPLRPYHLLMDLGGQGRSLSRDVVDWVRDGVLAEGAPAPSVGVDASTLEERQEAVKAHLERAKASFDELVMTQAFDTTVYDYPVTWELREQVVVALDSLLSRVLAVRPDVGD